MPLVAVVPLGIVALLNPNSRICDLFPLEVSKLQVDVEHEIHVASSGHSCDILEIFSQERITTAGIRTV